MKGYWDYFNDELYELVKQLKKQTMKTELDLIKKNLKIYRTSSNKNDLHLATKYLKTIHLKYGTIDINIIKEIIN